MALVGGGVAAYTSFFALTGLEPAWDVGQRVHNPYHTGHRAMGPFGSTVATATYAMLLLPVAVLLLSLMMLLMLLLLLL